jgi:MFS family permease
MQNVTVPFVVYETSGSAALVGFAGFAQFIPVVFAGPVGGWLADRHPRRSVLLATQSVHMLLATALWVAYSAGRGSVALLIGLVFLTGIVQGLNIPAWQAYVGELVPRHAVLNAVTLNSAQFNAARAIGPAVAGVVLARFGASWAFFVNAVSYAAVIAALASIPRSAGLGARAAVRRPLHVQFRASLQCVRATPGILSAIALMAVAAGFGQPIFQLMPVLADQVFHVEAWRYGLMAAALGTGGVLGAVALGAVGDGLPRSRLVRWSLALYAGAVLVVGLAPAYGVAVVALLVAGALYIAVVAPLNTTVQLQAPDHVRGGVFAIYMMTFNVAYPVGSLVQGALAELVNPRATVVGSAVAIAISVAVASWRRSFKALDGDVPQPAM